MCPNSNHERSTYLCKKEEPRAATELGTGIYFFSPQTTKKEDTTYSVDVRSSSYTMSVCNCTRVGKRGIWDMSYRLAKISNKPTCKTLGKLSLWASCVAIVDFPVHAVPHTKITSGTLWWWNLHAVGGWAQQKHVIWMPLLYKSFFLD